MEFLWIYRIVTLQHKHLSTVLDILKKIMPSNLDPLSFVPLDKIQTIYTENMRGAMWCWHVLSTRASFILLAWQQKVVRLLFLANVKSADCATRRLVGAVAGAFSPALDHWGRDRLAVVRPADPREKVNYTRCPVERVGAQLRRFVVPRKHVVVVVPTLTQRKQRHQPILRRLNFTAK